MAEQAKVNLSELCTRAIDQFCFAVATECNEFLVIGSGIHNDLSTGLWANGVPSQKYGNHSVVVMEISEREYLVVRGRVNQAELVDYFNPMSYAFKKGALTAKEIASAGTAQLLTAMFPGQEIEVNGRAFIMHLSVPKKEDGTYPCCKLGDSWPAPPKTAQAHLSDVCKFAIDNFGFCVENHKNEFLVEGDIYCDMTTGLMPNHVPATGGTWNIVVMKRSETQYLCVRGLINQAGLIDYFNPLTKGKKLKSVKPGKQKKEGLTATDIVAFGTSFILETYEPQEIDVNGHKLSMHIAINAPLVFR